MRCLNRSTGCTSRPDTTEGRRRLRHPVPCRLYSECRTLHVVFEMLYPCRVYILNVASFRVYSGCRILQILFWMPYLEGCIRGTVLRRVYSESRILHGLLRNAVSCKINSERRTQLGLFGTPYSTGCICNAVPCRLYSGYRILQGLFWMPHLVGCIRDAVPRILFSGCRSRRLYSGCCILQIVFMML